MINCPYSSNGQLITNILDLRWATLGALNRPRLRISSNPSAAIETSVVWCRVGLSPKTAGLSGHSVPCGGRAGNVTGEGRLRLIYLRSSQEKLVIKTVSIYRAFS